MTKILGAKKLTSFNSITDTLDKINEILKPRGLEAVKYAKGSDYYIEVREI